MTTTTTTIGALYAIPAQLRATAVAWISSMPDTQRERHAIIRALHDRAGLSITAARAACEQAAEKAIIARQARRPRRIVSSLGYCPVNVGRDTPSSMGACLFLTGSRRHGAARVEWRKPAHGQPKPARLQGWLRTISMDEALRRMRESAVLEAYRTAYRVPGAGHGDETVCLTDDPAQIGIRQIKSTDWDLYRGAYKGWAADVTDTVITVPTDWRVRVQRAGLDVADGLMTLDASRLEGAPDGVDLYAAAWLVQGRGYAISVVRGYIARQGGITYHGETADKALAGLRRKIAGAEWAATLAACDLSALMGRLTDTDLDGASVRVSDARAIGACEYGIRSWCHATGLPYDAGQASMRQVWAAYLAQPRTEARAAILHALRRLRRLAA